MPAEDYYTLESECQCPPEVIEKLRNVVQAEVDRLRAIQKSTAAINAAFADAPITVSSDIDDAMLAIPTFAIPNPLGILKYVVCPLFPFAIDMDLPDFSALDPSIQLSKIKDFLDAAIKKAQNAFEELLSASSNFALIEKLRTYLQEVARSGLNALSLANAWVVVGAVKVLCEEEYEANPVYEEFETLADGFSMDGYVPSGLNAGVKKSLESLQKAQARIEALKIGLV
jgi:hypothetical protein